jgi:hypothetical protein
MNFQHQLSLGIQVNNVDIYNVTHAGIHVESTDFFRFNIDTKIKFSNISASLCDLKTTSLFVLKEGANIQVYDSTFSFISNTLYGSVAYAGYQKAVGEFYNSEFKNNTSVGGGVFLTEEVSVIRLFNWSLTNNFAIGGGVAKSQNSGQFEFNSWYFGSNYANYAAVFRTIFNRFRVTIDNSTITKNIALKSDFILDTFIQQSKL